MAHTRFPLPSVFFVDLELLLQASFHIAQLTTGAVAVTSVRGGGGAGGFLAIPEGWVSRGIRAPCVS